MIAATRSDDLHEVKINFLLTIIFYREKEFSYKEWSGCLQTFSFIIQRIVKILKRKNNSCIFYQSCLFNILERDFVIKLIEKYLCCADTIIVMCVIIRTIVDIRYYVESKNDRYLEKLFFLVGHFIRRINCNAKYYDVIENLFGHLYENMKYPGKSILDVVKFLGTNKVNNMSVLRAACINNIFRPMLKGYNDGITDIGRCLKEAVLTHFLDTLVSYTDNKRMENKESAVNKILNEVPRICNEVDRKRVQKIIELYMGQ